MVFIREFSARILALETMVMIKNMFHTPAKVRLHNYRKSARHYFMPCALFALFLLTNRF